MSRNNLGEDRTEQLSYPSVLQNGFIDNKYVINNDISPSINFQSDYLAFRKRTYILKPVSFQCLV